MEGTVTHSQGIHDKMPIQLGRTKGEVYHTFCVLILKRNPLHIGDELSPPALPIYSETSRL